MMLFYHDHLASGSFWWFFSIRSVPGESGDRCLPTSYWGNHIFPRNIWQEGQVLAKHLRGRPEETTFPKMLCVFVTHHYVPLMDCNHCILKYTNGELLLLEGRGCISGISSGLWHVKTHNEMRQGNAGPHCCQEPPTGTEEWTMSSLPRNCHHWRMET